MENTKKNIESSAFDITDFNEDIRSLVYMVQANGAQGGFWNLNNDLLEMAFTELISSDTFIEMPGERRRDLFNQYGLLKMTLTDLESFADKNPESGESIKDQQNYFNIIGS